MVRIMVVEDDVKLNNAMCVYLRGCGYEVTGCLSANDAYNGMYNNLYDLIISDIMMKEIDGFEFAKTVRDLNETIPLLFVSARDDIQSKHRGFNLGIDDYMVKPIDFEELTLRVSALLRRANLESDRKIIMEHLVVDQDAMEILLDGFEVAVTSREFNILFKMLSYPNKTFSRAQLMDEFWGYDCETSLRAVDVIVTKLRDKFSECEDFEIRTIRGMGYKVVVR